jgi:SWI/SNF-related matrix-associated actin-dependent regulator of chromatin subfamily A3
LQAEFDDVASVPDLSQVRLSFRENAIFIGTYSAEKLGVMNEETSKILHSLSALESCHFEAYLPPDKRRGLVTRELKVDKCLYLPVDIIIYGSKAIRSSVSQLLSSEKIYLQHPCHQKPDSEYDNPHFLDLTKLFAGSGRSNTSRSGTHTSLVSATTSVGISMSEVDEDVSTQNRLCSKLTNVFRSLTRFKSLKRLEADARVITPLLS